MSICGMNEYKSGLPNAYSHNYLLSAYYETDIGLGAGKTTLTTLILNNNNNCKSIIANVYWIFTMYQALGQALVCILF